ncbi:AraC family transcriptional regulator [Gephyromycinifex aptenodytis]|uniref:AraC family transcriptional regulator n=1 Tax=Gephyromycinifex aptenodytis TaxID=2716227 RepID=UPI0014488834|nr:AraC family transcriptional regulator [Gephyromycinifex aptenodytis]
MPVCDIVLRHRGDELAIALAGSAVFAVEDGELVADRVHAVWIPAAHPHRVRSSVESLVMPLWIPPEQVAHTPSRPCLVRRTSRLESLARSLLQPQALRPLDIRRTQRELATEVASVAGVSGVPRLPRDPRARRVAEQVLRDPGDPRSREAWAASEHISSRTLSRLFQGETGMVFSQWRTAVRMERAARLLVEGTEVSVASRKCGYSTVSAFSTAFARHMGESPARYRRSHRRGN